MRRRTGVAALAGASAVTVLAVLVGAVTQPDPTPDPRPGSAPEAEPTARASYDTTGVGVVRGPFCDRVSPTGVEHALDDVPADSEQWDNGDRERLPDGSRDRVHEFGCRWTAADGTQASAWVFVPPVPRGQARALAAGVTADPCRPVPAAAEFGAPGATALCDLDTGNTRVQRAGLFGDAWLTCTLSAPGRPTDLTERANEWCVEVVLAARS